MIQKYVNENILLIPSALYKKQNAFIFDWTVDKRIKLTGYGTTYSFNKPGSHEIILKVTDIITGSYSTYKSIVNVCNFSQEYVESFTSTSNLGFGLDDFSGDDFGD